MSSFTPGSDRDVDAAATTLSRAETIRRALRVNISAAEHEEVLAALDSLLTDRDRYREALEEIEDSRRSFGSVELYANHAHRVAYNALAKDSK